MDHHATLMQRMFVLYGLWGVQSRAEHVAALKLARESLDLAGEQGDAEASALANRMMGLPLWAMGEFVDAENYFKRTLDFCTPGEEDNTDLRFSHDHRAATLGYLAFTLWPLGYPEQAASASEQALNRSRSIEHATTTGNVLMTRAMLTAGFGSDLVRAKANADESLAYCAEHGLSQWETWSRVWQGGALARAGCHRQGIEAMRSGMEAAKESNTEFMRTMNLGLLAAAHGSLG